jgi:hypothetical protein
MKRTAVRLQHERHATPPKRLRECDVLHDTSVAPERWNNLPNSTIARGIVGQAKTRARRHRSFSEPTAHINPNHVEARTPSDSAAAAAPPPPPLCIRGQPTTVPFPRLEVPLHARARAFGYSKTKSVWALVRVQRNAHMAPCPPRTLTPMLLLATTSIAQ